MEAKSIEEQWPRSMHSYSIPHISNVLAIERSYSKPENEGEEDLQRT